MAADAFGDWYVHRVQVDVPGQADDWGTATPVHHADVPCFLTGGPVLVTAPDGTQKTSTVTLSAPLDQADVFPPGARVTLPDRVATVIARTIGDSAGEWADLEGVTVNLT